MTVSGVQSLPLHAGALDVATAAATPVAEVLRRLDTSADGLSSAEVAHRRGAAGPNAVRSHHTSAVAVLARQMRSPLLALLVVTAIASYFVGERTDALIIGAILGLSIGLGFINEFRAERAAEALHSQIRHTAVVVRDGSQRTVDVTDLVPGDIVLLRLGEVVPADIRLLDTAGLECDEAVLTGESAAAEKSADTIPPGRGLAELSSCALMGTVVHAGSGRGVVVATGGRAEFGRIAVGLAERQPETEFQIGLRRFSTLLVQVAVALTVSIFLINVLLSRPLIDALLFSLAIAVGITPQLLPAVVTTSLAAGSRHLARSKVLVKRLVCIEDLGDVEVLFTDKTGTLTQGRIRFLKGIDTNGRVSDAPLLPGLLCGEPDGGGDALDAALWHGMTGKVTAQVARWQRVATLPFDHTRRMVSVVVDDGAGTRRLITKGAPETVLDRCVDVPAEAPSTVATEFTAGSRIVAVAARDVPGQQRLSPSDEKDLTLIGFLAFRDAPKASAAAALGRLADLGITVKVVTGDNATVAAKVCADLGLTGGSVVTGVELDAMDDAALDAVLPDTRIFARVTPDQKARIVRAQRRTGMDVAFLGDGVNDAVALHAADVGISVDSGADVAKDAADVVLLEKDLGVVADGVQEGRRIFANTIKYVLMGTSSNFGNMFSAAGASAMLSFLPMLPSQILLNNLLYDSSQLAIPTDRVDAEQLARPARWDIHFIRRFMLFFGPISSIFDFLTFGVMLWLFQAGPSLFRTGWFVESLATQTLVIFAIRTRRIPFLRSRASVALTLAALGVVVVGALLPLAPFADTLGFQPLPALFFLTLCGMVLAYLGLIELGKHFFFGRLPATPVVRERRPGHRLLRRARRFSVGR